MPACLSLLNTQMARKIKSGVLVTSISLYQNFVPEIPTQIPKSDS